MHSKIVQTPFTVAVQPDLALDLLSCQRLGQNTGHADYIREALAQACTTVTTDNFHRKTDLMMMALAAAGYVTYTYDNGMLPQYALTESGERLLNNCPESNGYIATAATITEQPGIMADWMHPSRFGNMNGEDIKFILDTICASEDGRCYLNPVAKLIAIALALCGYITFCYAGAGDLGQYALTDAGKELHAHI